LTVDTSSLLHLGVPFTRRRSFYSDAVVAACAKLGTHYVDITGEIPWVRSCIDRYDDRARATGACIVNCCGYDSIPSDLGALFAVNTARSRAGAPAAPVKLVTNYQIPLGGAVLSSFESLD
jgi:short subunit dehydrogenase-like uncharacterized protein